MPKFIPYDYNQDTMVVINFEEQLQPGTFEHTLHYLIENKLDLSVFHPEFQNDDGGRPAYDPAILLKIILFAYSKGITSSREIEWSCKNNILFKALSCDSVAHFTTIAHFISSYTEAIADLFEQVLLVCDQQGLLGHDLLAIDGCKMSSNAAKEWSGTFKELEQKRNKIRRRIKYHLAEHKKADLRQALDDERRQRTKQTVKTLNHAFDKIDNFLKTSRPRIGQGRQSKEVKSNITDNESAKMTTSKGTLQGYTGIAAVDKKHQIIVDAQAFGVGQEHHTLKPVLESIEARYRRLNIFKKSFPNKLVITADTGFANEANMQYLYDHNINGYIPDNKFRSRDSRFTDYKMNHSTRPASAIAEKTKTPDVIPPSEFTLDPINKRCTCPAGESMWLKHEGIDKRGNNKLFFEGRLTKCRSCPLKLDCLRNPESPNTRKGHGRQVSFIIERRDGASYTDWMKQRIDSDLGKHIYSHRMAVVEPVFANIGTNKGLKRFSLRSRRKVQGQWQYYCLVHNIEKLAHYGRMVA